MKIVIPGGSGQIGTLLANAFHAEHEVVVLSRDPAARPWRVVHWDGATPGDWTREIDGSDVVINLAGRSVLCRYTARHRQEILESRVISTRVVGEAIAAASKAPRAWLQASTATLYAHRYDGPNDEETGLIGGDEADSPAAWAFSIDVARAWERAFDSALTPRTRKVKMRSAIVMSPDSNGPFDLLLRLVRAGLGGRAGDGKQFVSWIHHEDFVRAIRFLMDRLFIDGAVNLAAPNPLPNVEFMKAIREAWGQKFYIPAPGWMLEMGAFLLRTETELVLKSRRVVPTRLQQRGFTFRYPNWADAARALCEEWKQLHGHATGAARTQGSW